MNPAPPVTRTRMSRESSFCRARLVEKTVSRQPWLLLAAAGEHSREGTKQNFYVQAQRPTPDVLEVQAHPIVQIVHLVPAADLPQSGDARLYRQFPFLKTSEALVLADQGRAWAHQAHLAFENTVELRQFIQTIAAHPLARPGHARVVGYFEDRPAHLVGCLQLRLEVIGVVDHGPELVAEEWSAAN